MNENKKLSASTMEEATKKIENLFSAYPEIEVIDVLVVVSITDTEENVTVRLTRNEEDTRLLLQIYDETAGAGSIKPALISTVDEAFTVLQKTDGIVDDIITNIIIQCYTESPI